MTTLVALIALPFVVIGTLLILAEVFGKKKQWN